MAEYADIELLIAKIDSEGLDYAVDNYPDVFSAAGLGVGMAARDVGTALEILRDAITGAAAEHPDLAERWHYMS